MGVTEREESATALSPPRLHDRTGEQTHRKPRIYPCGHWPAAKPRTVTQLIRIDPSVTFERALPRVYMYVCARFCACAVCLHADRLEEGERGREGTREREIERSCDVLLLTIIQRRDNGQGDSRTSGLSAREPRPSQRFQGDRENK